MTFKMLMQISLRSLRHHKGRTFLTMLGIIIGVGAVIATMAIGAGAQKKLQEKVASLGENFVVIQAGNRIQQGKIQGKSRKSKPLKENDIEVIEKQCENIRRASPVIYGSGTLEANGVTIKCECKSGNSNFIKMLGRKIILGSNLTPEHIKNKRRVVVIGYKAATELFKGANPIGKYIKHRGKSFLVIGVMQHIENYFNSIDPDFDCIFPITTARRYIMDNPWGQYIHSINIEAQDQEKMPALIRQARRILRALHHLKEKDSDDFTIWDQDSIAKAAKESSGIMRLLLLIVASISLLVGG
ncbi:ABC transporter permease, partial [bacterium]|nr:ABC transporter permease [bacterium]